MNLQSLVPPLELCKLIPKGEFEDSAFYWFADLMQINKTPPHEYKYTVHEADYKGYNWGGFRCYPAPTLQEILKKFSIWTLKSENNEQQGSCIDVLEEDFEVFKTVQANFMQFLKLLKKL